MEWEQPSPRVAELMRRGAEITLDAPAEWLAEIDEATLTGEHFRAIAEDPVLAAATRRTNRANLRHWAEANVANPGEPVPANLGPEPVATARDLVRRGLDESALHAYRLGENAAWQLWMRVAFELTSDPEELQELLELSARSISSFIDATILAISEQMQLEREELTRGTQAERREVVALILDGAPITRERAATRLAYELAQPHTAAVIWSERLESDLSELEHAAEALAHAAGSPRPLSVLASATTLWVWAGGADGPELAAVARAIAPTPDVRVAVGTTADGVEGFRRSHHDALTTQRMLARLRSDQQLASYDDVALVALVTEDEQRAAEFVQKTLGEFESASPELHDAVRTYVREQSNASRAAKRLYTHRNSLLRRLARADELLPRPLSENGVEVAVALEVLRWRGTAV